MKTEKSALLLFRRVGLWLALAACLPTQAEAEPAHLGAKGARSRAESGSSETKKIARAARATPGDPREQAADAYDAGADALARKDYRDAARNFEQAHRIQSSEVAREQAIKSYMRAGDTVHAATLALEAPREHEQLLRDAIARNALVVVSCDRCTVELDGEPMATRSFIVESGAHRLRAHFPHGSVLRKLDASVGQRLSLNLQAPAGEAPLSAQPSASTTAATTPTAARARSGGLPKIATYSLFGLTAIAVGATTWSLFDMQSAGQRYEDALAQAERAPTTSNVGRANDALEQARSAEQRSHWLIGVSAALVASSAVVGLLLTDWNGDGEVDEGPQLALAPGRAVASWRHSW